MDLTGLRYVVVEGPIGVGKTSLARLLGERLGAELLRDHTRSLRDLLKLLAGVPDDRLGAASSAGGVAQWRSRSACAVPAPVRANTGSAAAQERGGLSLDPEVLANGGPRGLYQPMRVTLPGFTAISMFPKLWEASGVRAVELVTKLIDLALERHTRRAKLATKI